MRILGAIALAAALTVPAVAQQAQPPQQPTPQQPTPQERPSQKDQKPVGTAGAMTVEAIVDNPERYYDKDVTVSGDVGEVFGTNKKAFNIQEEGIIDVDDRLLVLSDEAVTNLDENSIVQVRGKVRQFVRSELERELGIKDWNAFGFDQDFWTENERKPVLIADSVTVRKPGERK